jgi:hypothetical protein
MPFVLILNIIPETICHLGGYDFDCHLGNLIKERRYIGIEAMHVCIRVTIAA